MRIMGKISIAFIIALLTMFAGCGKNDDRELNMITISGNELVDHDYNQSYTTVEGLYTPVLWKCEESLEGFIINIDFLPEAIMVIYIFRTESSETLAPGTFAISPHCTLGAEAGFELKTGAKAMELWMSSGTVTIAKDGGTYDIHFNLVIDPNAGGGTLKGHFHGEMGELVLD